MVKNLFLASLSLLLIACNDDRKDPPAAARTVPEVDVVIVHPKPLINTIELPGRTVPYRIAEIRPQVDGIIQQRTFVEGSDVKASQQLYQIDDARYRAAFKDAQGILARAKANLTTTHLKAKRYKELVALHAISQQEYDDATAALQADEANVLSYQAALDSAQINLDYTKIKSPISGRIGKSLITEGALAVTNQQNPLATVQQLDPLYVDITQPSINVLTLERAGQKGTLNQNKIGKASVTLILEDGSVYDKSGTLEFTDITVDPTTGAVTLRALFPNPHQDLKPGMFVRAVLEQGQNEKAITVAQQAVMRDQRGNATVLLVNDQNNVEVRKITADRALKDQWLVHSGLQGGERLIVSGAQKIKPGDTVKPVVVQQAPQ